MNTNHDIRYLKRHEIDIEKWDRCIDESQNGLVYGYSFYLDHLAKRWDALVAGDYEIIMPLTWNKKWGISYLYQPPFLPQSGIFSKRGLDAHTILSFITEAKKYFRFAEIFLNHGNPFPGGTPAVNLILPLHNAYEHIRSGYKNDLVKNLKQSIKSPLAYTASTDYTIAIKLYKQQYAERTPHVSSRDYASFAALCKTMLQKNRLIVRKVYETDTTLLAIAIFFTGNGRLYNIMSTVLPEGRDLSANHFLFDELIGEFAGTGLLLDFEGSSIPGIAAFYKTFGAVDEPYYFLKYNNLPWPLRSLKK